VQITGQPEETTLRLGFPVAEVWEADLLEDRIERVAHSGSTVRVKLAPWGIHTYRVKVG
jgi:hypothetical protein